MRRALLFLVRRLGWALVLVAGVTSLSFLVAQLLPGDPARMLVGPQASAADAEHVRALYGLDQPVLTRYARYWGRLLHRRPPGHGGAGSAPAGPGPAGDGGSEHESCAAFGPLHVDLGYSFTYGKPVVALLAARAPRSFELALAALLVQLLLGVGAGVVAAARPGTLWDEATVGATLLGLSAPTFLLGLGLQYVLAYRLRLLPYDGYGTTAAEHARSIVLPALTLGIYGSALYARLVRDELSTLLRQDFVRTARAKGASALRVLVVHALRNALVPIATLAVLELGALIGGAIVTEKLFRWPGVGQLAVEALVNRDGPVIFGTVLFASTAVVLSSLALDVLHLALDPRLRR